MHLPTRRIDAADLDRMTGALFFEGMKQRSKLSRFWILLLLSGVIASAGVVSDSTATVIGAMIVAPLMTPIIGTALAFVLTDRAMLRRSVLLIVLGASAVIVIGFVFGLSDLLNTAVEGNPQVTGRVNPGLIDLVAALATGLVGAFALVRSDVSDTLPGVAIAISLVPPLAVCGLVLQDGQYAEAFGALLLFATNVSAIVATGTLTLIFYGVREQAAASGRTVLNLTKKSLATVLGMVVLVAVPLAAGTLKIVGDQRIRFAATPIAVDWAEQQNWAVVEVEVDDGLLTVTALGAPPQVEPAVLRDQLDNAGLQEVDLEVALVLGGTKLISGVPTSAE
ncbi:MAG: TIGR00341 family protein [Actinomycetia bacterium]|nr:TIGR00341 family protein [Actinomycetes bacterium]